jgi:hypothetical protein
MPDLGDLVSFDFQPQTNLDEWASGLGGGAYSGADMPAQPQGGYASLDTWGAGPSGGFSVAPDSSTFNPSYFQPDILRSQNTYAPSSMTGDASGWITNPSAGYSPNQSLGFNTPNTTLAPNVGNAGGSGQASQNARKEDDWKTALAKFGLGVGTSAAGMGLQALMQPSQKSQGQPGLTVGQPVAPVPPPPGLAQAAPMSPELQPLPGTLASPLISQRPTQVQQSTGLNAFRRPNQPNRSGGFSLY